MNLKLVVANMLQNTEPNLRRFSVAKCSAALPSSNGLKYRPALPHPPLLPDDARRISCLDFYSFLFLIFDSQGSHLAFHRQITKIIFQADYGSICRARPMKFAIKMKIPKN